VSNVNSDLSSLQGLHAAPTVSPASAIATGNTALASAWNSINTAQGLASQHGC
jgi:hypothetical protein